MSHNTPDHWAFRRPGLADQYKHEAIAAREALGLGDEKSDDVSPNDITAAIAKLKEGAGDRKKALAAVDYLERLLVDAGFRCEPEYAKIRRALAALPQPPDGVESDGKDGN